MLGPILAVAALAAGHVAAQTYTPCNPLNSTCPADPALGSTYSQVFNNTQSGLDTNYWNITAGASLLSMTPQGAALSINKQGDSFTAQTSFYIFWGQVEIMMQAAAGQGIISTMNLLSDDLDEIDWEIMGGNTSFVETNWYGKGNLSQSNAVYVPCENAQTQLHNYTVNWTQQQIQWILDGQVVRTVPYAPAGQYPQTPSFIKFGIWAGGDPTEPAGTIAWAGGPVNYKAAPFTMNVASIKITDGSTNTSSYAYGDQSGSWQSVKLNAGKSTAATQISKPPPETVQQHWEGLSSAAKIGIAVGVLGGLAIALAALLAFCCVQRRRGRRERVAADRQWNEEQSELMAYNSQMDKGAFAASARPMPAY